MSNHFNLLILCLLRKSNNSALSQVRGFQGTLQLDGVELLDIDYGEATAQNFGLRFIEQGYLTMSWNQESVQDEAVLFSLVLKANENRMLSEVLSVNDRYTMAESYKAPSVLADISLGEGEETSALGIEFTTGLADGPVFELYQNTPNPFVERTMISFNLPEASKAMITISDASGRVLHLIKGEYGAGYNTVHVTKTMLQGASGVLSYTIKAGEHTATRQMIVLQ